MRFDAALQLNGVTATGIPVPQDVLEGLGGGRRPRVDVTINEYTYQVALGTMSGQVMIPVSAVVRAETGAKAGDILSVEIELATEPAPVAVPDLLRTALAEETDAAEFFARLTPSQQRGYADWIATAKTPETAGRRLAQTIEALREHRTRH